MNKPHFGIIGLGVMGRSLARNVVNKGIPLAVYNRLTPAEKEVIPSFLESVKTKDVLGTTELSKFVDSLATPRSILLMVNAGSAVDSVIASLSPLLSSGDSIIDGGNSHYIDTQRRVSNLEEKGIHFIGTGISGGEDGALNGPSMMVGGAAKAYENVRPIFEAIAAKDKNEEPCVALFGTDGCGHLVKTIHNGIEYAEMQLLAECYSLLATEYTYPEIAAIFKDWNQSELQSYLLEITSGILLKKEGDDFLLDKVLDKAGSKGTGSWTSQTAFQLGVPAPTINAAVTARYLSALKDKRLEWGEMVPKRDGSVSSISIQELKAAYTFARIINHHQGFEIIREASKENNWGINLSELARVWTAGCIIKSSFMESLVETFKKTASILEDPSHFNKLIYHEKDVLNTLKKSFDKRISITSMSNSYSYFISLTTSISSANMIQAQRDEFGAHTYKRNDKPSDQSFTTKWTTNG